MYFAWDRAAEATAPLGILENRFPALFEVRRLFWPRFEALADPECYDQGIDGFLEQVFLANFKRFAQLAQTWTGYPVQIVHRRWQAEAVLLDAKWLSQIDTLIIISFDGPQSCQQATPAELTAMEDFLDDPAHTVFVCPHHNVGDTHEMPVGEANVRQRIEFDHHGDRAVPGQQHFGGFALSLMRGLDLPIRNRFGLRPAQAPDGTPAPLELTALDRRGLFTGVQTLNAHPHLPHFERQEGSLELLEVLVRQRIDPGAPPHPFCTAGHTHFDAVLQAKPAAAAGCLIVADATLWSSTAGGLESIERLWRNVALPHPGS
jgi:hypothetical protein